MEPLTIETFNPDMIEAVISEQKKAGEINYTSVKFEYDGGAILPLRIDGKFRLFRSYLESYFDESDSEESENDQ